MALASGFMVDCEQSRSSHAQLAANYLARRQRMIIIRRLCVVTIIMAGIFTMVWANTIHAPRYRKHPPQQQQIKPTLSHLILIPGHSIQQCNDLDALERNTNDCWYLLDYQRGQHRLHLEFIKAGIAQSEQDPNSMLIFSGGKTREAVGPISEADSYKQAALLYMQSLKRPFNTNRWAVEEFARDSFENLAFSLCLFKQASGNYPEKITVIGFPFKEPRFRDLHWPTIQKYLDQDVQIEFDYVGVHLEGYNQHGLIDRAYPLFQRDPLGQSGVLAEKRRERNPFRQQHSYDCLSFLREL